MGKVPQNSENKRRVNLVMDVDVVKTIDEYAEQNGISRSGAISVLCMQMLKSLKATEAMTELKGMFEQYKTMFEENKQL